MAQGWDPVWILPGSREVSVETVLGSPSEEGRQAGLTFRRTTTFPRKSSCPLSLRASLKILKGTNSRGGGKVSAAVPRPCDTDLPPPSLPPSKGDF